MHSQQVWHCLELCLTSPYYNALTTYMGQVSGVGLGSMALESGILLLSHFLQWGLERPGTKLTLDDPQIPPGPSHTGASSLC